MVESLKIYEVKKATKGRTLGDKYEEWKIDGYFGSLDAAFVHCGRKFLERIDWEVRTDALEDLFALTDSYKELGKEAVARLPKVPA